MIKVGDRDVIFHQTILVPTGEDVWITIPDGHAPLKLQLVFEDLIDPNSKPNIKVEASVKVEGKGDHALVTLVNWRSVGITMENPMRIGTTSNGRDIFIMIDGSRMAKIAKIFVQVMLGGA